MVNKELIEQIITKSIFKHNHGLSGKQRLAMYKPEEFSDDSEDIDKFYLAQNEAQLKVEYGRWDKNYVHYYSKNTYHVINSMLWENDEWKEGVESGLYDDQEYYEEVVNGLDKVIEKSPSIRQNGTLFRGGTFPKGMKPGDIGKFKGFTSTSMNPHVAEQFQSTDEERYNIKIRIPKGSKGVVFNEQFETFSESELLLGRNQKYVVLNVDDNKKEVEILLYDT